MKLSLMLLHRTKKLWDQKYVSPVQYPDESLKRSSNQWKGRVPNPFVKWQNGQSAVQWKFNTFWNWEGVWGVKSIHTGLQRYFPFIFDFKSEDL